MCGASKAKTNQTSTYTPTQQASGLYSNVINQATGAANTGYNPATAKTVAGFTPEQQQAFNSMNASSGNYQPFLNQSAGFAAAGAAPIGANQIQQYMDPYQQQVIDATMANINHNNAAQLSQVTGNAASNYGGFGNRAGVAQAETIRGQNANANQTIAQLQSQGFGQALSAAQADATRQQTAASQFANLAQTQQGLSMNDIMAQLGIGNQQQAQQQNINDTASANAQQQTMWPYQNAQWLAGIASGVGPLTGGTQSGTSTTQQGKGSAGVLGSALSLASMFSDRRMKEDSQVIGKTFDGQKIYKFRYKGSPRWQVGLMADEVQKNHPEAVSSGPAGMKMVNYDTATEDSERGHFASGAGVGFSDDYFPWADIRPASTPSMSLPSAPSASSSSGGGFDPQKSIKLGQSARSGIDNLMRELSPSQGWAGGTSIEPAGGGAAGGKGLSGLGSMLGFAAGGGIPWDDNPFMMDRETGKFTPPKLRDEVIPGDIGESGAPQSPPDAGGGFDPSSIWPNLFGGSSDEAKPSDGKPSFWDQLSNAGAPPSSELPPVPDRSPRRDAGADIAPAGIDVAPGGFGSLANEDSASPLFTGSGRTDPASSGFGTAVERQAAGPGLSATDFVKDQEGLTPRATWDKRQYSNGYGTKALHPGEVIDQPEADRRLNTELGKVTTWLDSNVKVPLTPEQKTGLTSFGHNLGVGALQKLLPDINAGNWSRVTQRMPTFDKALNDKTGELEPNAALRARRLREAALVNQTTPVEGGSAPSSASMGPSGGGAAAETHPGLVAKATNPGAPVTGGYTGPADKQGGGLLKRWFGIDFNPLKLSEDERMAMLQAGLGMMSSGNIGTGGMQGMQFLRDKQLADREASFKAQNLAMELERLRQPQFGPIGTNPLTGQSQYGFANKTDQTVTPVGGSGGPTSITNPEDAPAWAQEKARRVAAGLEPMPKQTRGDPTGNIVQQTVRAMDNGYNENRYKFRQSWEDPNKYLQKTLQANNTAIKHASELSQLIDTLPDTGYKDLNEAKNWWRGKTTDPNLLQWQATAALLAPEIVRVMNPTTGGGVHERSAELEKLNPANGKAALHKALAQYTKLMAERTSSLKSTWDHEMGSAETPMILDDDAKASVNQLQQRYGAAPASVERPQVSDDEILAGAQREIRAGRKSPEAIKKQLKAWNIPVERLQP